MAVSEELREEMGKKGNVELMMSETRVHVSLVPRPHPAHVRRRGLVSQVQILGLAPEAWSGQSDHRAGLLE